MFHLHKFIFFISLVVFTLFCTEFIGRYQPIGPELLLNSNFDEGLVHWHQTGKKDSIVIEHSRIVRLRSSDKSSTVSITQNVNEPRRFDVLRLSGDIKVANVKAGEKKWHKARLLLISFDVKGRWLHSAHGVVSLTGSYPWKHYTQVLRVLPKAKQLRVSTQLLKTTGTMWIKNLSLREIVEKPVYLYLKTVCIVLWTIFLFWFLTPLIFGCKGFILRGIVFLTISAILLGTLMPATKIQQLRDYLVTTDKIEKVKVEERESLLIEWHYIKTTGHFILFAVLGMSLALGFPLENRKLLLLNIAILAGATELLQFFTEGRRPLIHDWFIDNAGAVLGLILLYLSDLAGKDKRTVI